MWFNMIYYYVVDRRWTYCTRVPCRWPITSWWRPGTMPPDRRTPPTRAKCAKSATRIAPPARRHCGGTRETSTAPTRTCRVTCPAAAGGFSRRPCAPTTSRTTLTAATAAVSGRPRKTTAATTSATGRRWLANSAADCPLTGQRTPSTWTRRTPRRGPPCAACVTRTRATCGRSSTTCGAGTSSRWRPLRRRRRGSADATRSGSAADGPYGAPCAASGTATTARCALTGGCTASPTTTSSRRTRIGPVGPVQPRRRAVAVVRCTYSRVYIICSSSVHHSLQQLRSVAV